MTIREDLCVLYSRPQSVEEALSLLSGSEPQWTVLAGGTDVFPAHCDKPLTGPVLDISGLDDLRSISIGKKQVRIGALASWRDICNAPLPGALNALKQAGREVGSIQVQNRATVAGNICNASPAADGVPPLLVTDAQVHLTSVNGDRAVAVEEFITGNRQTRLRPGELVTAISISKDSLEGVSQFAKLGARKYLVISIASVAARLVADENGTIKTIALAAGACSPVPVRLRQLERALTGARADNLASRFQTGKVEELLPVDDIRASADYRLEAVLELASRVVAACLERAGHA